MSAHEYLELLSGYVLGALAPAERAVLEAHLDSGCAECEAELARLDESMWLMAHAAPRRRAPRAVALRALALIDTETAGRRPAGAMPAPAPIPLRVRRRPSRLVWGLAAAAALLAVAGAMSWMNAQRATRELAAARAENARLAARLEDERRWAQALASPAARTVSLAATPAAAGLAGPPTARVTYDPVSRRAIVVVANFVAPAGKDFELWAITKAGPASLGLVRAAPSGEAVLRLENVGDPATLGAFAVSLEEKGGAPTPHAPAGPVVMVGKLSG